MALIAYLMEFKGNYGPHLIIVPNAVLVNWKVSCFYSLFVSFFLSLVVTVNVEDEFIYAYHNALSLILANFPEFIAE